jgi:hypothetical protein
MYPFWCHEHKLLFLNGDTLYLRALIYHEIVLQNVLKPLKANTYLKVRNVTLFKETPATRVISKWKTMFPFLRLLKENGMK